MRTPSWVSVISSAKPVRPLRMKHEYGDEPVESIHEYESTQPPCSAAAPMFACTWSIIHKADDRGHAH